MAGDPSILEIETAALSSWPALRTAHDRSWVWRWAKGYTKRANSVQALDPADDEDLERRLGEMAKLSRRNRIEPVFRVTPLAAPRVAEVLAAAGWDAFDESIVLTGPLPQRDLPPGVEGREVPSTTWAALNAAMSGYDEASRATLAEMLAVIPAEARAFTATAADGAPAASALAVRTGRIVGLFNVVTAPRYRRQGLARRLLDAAFAWGREAGAGFAAIQVVATNEPAKRLYASYGLAERYRYHYRRPAVTVLEAK
ncbi:GNAT family N-acetyltransferase [Chelatococcus sp. GCM10030263]|uniref:GNAT family N-acetyltransferase n=1 Tax=Chelatococcus sp. GCM10030263 TaxID=3273387 RepID=UPI00362040C1